MLAKSPLHQIENVRATSIVSRRRFVPTLDLRHKHLLVANSRDTLKLLLLVGAGVKDHDCACQDCRSTFVFLPQYILAGEGVFVDLFSLYFGTTCCYLFMLSGILFAFPSKKKAHEDRMTRRMADLSMWFVKSCDPSLLLMP